ERISGQERVAKGLPGVTSGDGDGGGLANHEIDLLVVRQWPQPAPGLFQLIGLGPEEEFRLVFDELTNIAPLEQRQPKCGRRLRAPVEEPRAHFTVALKAELSKHRSR